MTITLYLCTFVFKFSYSLAHFKSANLINLPPIKKSMPDYSKQIKEFEAELGKMQYNKHTQKHYGLVRAKIAKLRETEISRSKGSKMPDGYSVKKSGDATVILVGFPSAGKSTLLNVLTDAKSKVGAYAFTTLTVIPGLMKYENAKIQVLDVPGIVEGAASGRGRGREVLAVMRTADLCLILIDVNYPEHLPVLKKEIYDAGLRLDQRLPEVKITRKPRGGLDVATTVKLTHMTFETIEAVLKEMRIHNADVVIRTDITVDQLIDIVEGNKIYLPSVVVLNKIDLVDKATVDRVKAVVKPDLCISAQEKISIGDLKNIIFKKLDLIRLYCKEVGKKADLDVPLIMKRSSTIRDVCNKLHRDFVGRFKFARVWGSSKFPGQKLSLGYPLRDGDVVELHLR